MTKKYSWIVTDGWIDPADLDILYFSDEEFKGWYLVMEYESFIVEGPFDTQQEAQSELNTREMDA